MSRRRHESVDEPLRVIGTCTISSGKPPAPQELDANSRIVTASPGHATVTYIDARTTGAPEIHQLADHEVETLGADDEGFEPDRAVLGSMLLQQAPPLPVTPLDGLYLLAPCDTAITDANGKLRVYKDPRWLDARHVAGDAQAPLTTPDSLLDGLVDALRRSGVHRARDPALLLSAGKDSVGLFLALRETLGSNFRCLTLRGTSDDQEADFAGELCARFGVTHQALNVGQARISVGHVADFFARAALPTLDHVNLAYLAAHTSMHVAGADLIDGLGNDAPFGHLPDAKERIKQRWSWLRNTRLSLDLEHRFGLPTKSFGHPLRGTAANMGLYNYFGPGELERMGLAPAPWPGYFEEIARTSEARALPYPDLRGLVRGAHLDTEVFMRRTRNFAAAVDGTATFPWGDSQLGQALHNLSPKQRYTETVGPNKLLLRELLADRLGYAEPKRGFAFDTLGFVRTNASVLHEIIDSTEVGRLAARAFLARDWKRLESGPKPVAQFAAYRLQSLFQICAWLRFSRMISANRHA